jgi:gliding motility-associated-like protein
MDSVRIKVYKNVIVPNAFSPNGDGINDTWQIEALSAYPNAEVLVFNREGKIVFTSLQLCYSLERNVQRKKIASRHILLYHQPKASWKQAIEWMAANSAMIHYPL